MISRNELRTLAEQRDQTSVSIYMPAVKAGSEIQQNPIRFKNLLNEAENQLREAGLDTVEIAALLQPAQQLMDDEVFWQQQSAGLALFLASGQSRAFRMPLEFESLVVVTDHFHLKPLFRLLSHDGQFYILALSQKGVRLFQGSHYSVSEVNVEDVPESVYELLDYDELERHLQFHSRTRTPGAASGDRPAAFHGQSVAKEDEKQDIKKYFQRIDNALEPFLEDGKRPLVLAGVDYLLPIYRDVSSYPYLADEEIVGSPKTWDADALHARAWEIVAPSFADKEAETRRRYKELQANAPSRTSQELEEIVSAAYFERVAALFVDKDAHCWGTFDPESNEVVEHEAQQAGDEDLLDLAAIHTFLNSGQLFSVSSTSMPDETTVAAILRY